MLSFEEWKRAISDTEQLLADTRQELEYRMLEITGGPGVGKARFTSEMEDTIDHDKKVQELRYWERALIQRRDYIKTTGNLPPIV